MLFNIFLSCGGYHQLEKSSRDVRRGYDRLIYYTQPLIFTETGFPSGAEACTRCRSLLRKDQDFWADQERTLAAFQVRFTSDLFSEPLQHWYESQFSFMSKKPSSFWFSLQSRVISGESRRSGLCIMLIIAEEGGNHRVGFNAQRGILLFGPHWFSFASSGNKFLSWGIDKTTYERNFQ